MRSRNTQKTNNHHDGSRSRRRNHRRGAVTAELALCLPMLLVTGLGMIETINLVSVQARLQSVAYEAARLATRPTTSSATAATSAQVQAYGQTLLTQLGISGATVTPPDLSNAPPQTVITVTVSAPWSQNSATSFLVSNSLNLSSQATLIVE